jgi:hypothetical protein
LESLQIWVTIVIGTATILVGLYKYFGTREHELSWRQTEFVLNQAHYLEPDEDIIDAVMVLRNEHIYSIQDIFGEDGNISNEEIYKYRKKFYKLFNLLDRLAYLCLHKKAISISEMSNFGMYYTSVSRNKILTNYCKKNSFPILLKMAANLEEYFKDLKLANNRMQTDAALPPRR